MNELQVSELDVKLRLTLERLNARGLRTALRLSGREARPYWKVALLFSLLFMRARANRPVEQSCYESENCKAVPQCAIEWLT
ncbi:MAG: hypothetical protein QOG23_4896 [Blastocatellia bacterium]|nr:hypothetical protein [Blastocatellia bacterium]